MLHTVRNALVAAFIASTVIGIVTAFGDQLRNALDSVADAVNF